MFEVERRALERRFARMERADDFADIRLTVSFRSAPAILEAVDAAFADAANRRGLGADAAQQPHQSWRASLPGRVELWPLIGAVKSDATPGVVWLRRPPLGPRVYGLDFMDGVQDAGGCGRVPARGIRC